MDESAFAPWERPFDRESSNQCDPLDSRPLNDRNAIQAPPLSYLPSSLDSTETSKNFRRANADHQKAILFSQIECCPLQLYTGTMGSTQPEQDNSDNVSDEPSDDNPVEPKDQDSQPLVFREPKFVEAEAVPPEGCAINPGTVLSGDGSRVTFDVAADGKVRPMRIVFANGETCSYEYNTAGVLIKATLVDAGLKEIWSMTSADGKAYTMLVNGKKVIDAVECTAVCRIDGTVKLTRLGERPQSWQTSSEGALICTFKGAGNTELRTMILPDKSVITLRKRGDGNFHPNDLVCPDGTTIRYSFDENGRPRQIVEIRRHLAPVFYDSADGGRTWQRTIKNDADAVHSSQTGSLTLDKHFRPVFKDSGEAALEVTDNGTPRSESDKQRARVAVLQETLTKTCDSVYEARARDKVAEIQTQWQAELRARGGLHRLAPDEQEAALKDYEQRIQKALEPLKKEKEEALAGLRQEMILLRQEASKPENERRSTEELWKDLPTTRKLYRESLEWLEKKAIPSTLQQLCGPAGGEIPPNNPHAVPRHEEGAPCFLDPHYYRSLAAGGAYADKVKLPVDVERIPDANALETIGRAIEWLVDVEQRRKKQRLDYEASVMLPTIIRENRLPEQWLTDFGENPEGKRAAMKELLDIAFKLRKYTAAMVMLKLDKDGEGPVFFIDGSRGKIPPPPFSEPIHKDGKVLYKFSWPESLNLEDPRNLEKIEAFKEWLNKYGEVIDKLLEAWAQSCDPRKRLYYGEIEGDVHVKMDKEGRLNEIVEPPNATDTEAIAERKKKAMEGSTRCNLLSSDFEVEERNGRYFVKATLQAKNAELYNYLNIGAQKIGRPAEEGLGETDEKGQQKGFAPDDPVAIRDGSGQIHVVAAKDLRSWKEWQRFTYWGTKISTAVMDGGMTIAGLATAGTAVLAWNATKITAGVALRTVIPALLRAGLGASGFLLNNAKAHSDPAWRTVNEIRGGLMVLDVLLGNIRGIAGWFGAGRSAEAVAAARKFATAMEEGLQSSHWILKGIVKPAYYATEVEGFSTPYHWLMGGTNVYYGPTIVNDIVEHTGVLRDLGKRDPYQIALRYVEGGRVLTDAPLKADRVVAEQRREENIKLFDAYIALITQRKNLDPETRERVLQIAKRTRALLIEEMPDELTKPDVPEERREAWRKKHKEEIDAYKTELMDYIYGSSTSVAERIVQSNKGKSVAESLPSSRMRNLSGQDFSGNRDLQTAAAAALLALSADQKGGLPADGILAKRTVEIPPHQLYEQRTTRVQTPRGEIVSTARVEVDGPRKANQEVRVEDLAVLLKRNVTGDSTALKMVSADILVKIGARDQLSYAAVVRGTAADTTATDIERTAAIAQLAQMINAMRLIEANKERLTPEEQDKFLAYSFGLTSKDLHATLMRIAADKNSNNNIRGLAAALLADLATTVRPEELNCLIHKRVMESAKYIAADYKGTESYADVVSRELLSDLKSTDAATRLRAALALRSLGDLGPFSGSAGIEKFNHAMVQIAQIGARNGRYSEVGARAVAELQLTDESSLTAEDRQTLKSILEEPTTQSTALLKTVIARRAHEIARTDSERVAFAETLAEHISFGNRLYGEKFPALRESCIYAISNLGVTTVAPALAQCLRPPEEGKRPYKDFEPDARVRLAALQALIVLRAPGLDQLLMNSFDKETDVAVRSRLLEVKVRTHRPVPDWTWFHERDRLAGEIIDGSKYSTNGASAYLCGVFSDFLHRGGGIEVPNATYTTRELRQLGGQTTPYGYVPTYGYVDVVYKNPKFVEFWAKWDEEVFNKCRQDSKAGHEARMALIHIVIRQGDPMRGSDSSPDRRKIVEKSMERIIELLHPGSGFRGEMMVGVREILADSRIDPSLRLHLLEALQKYIRECPEIEKQMKAEGKIRNDDNLAANYRLTVAHYVVDALKADLTSSNQVSPDNGSEFSARQALRMKMLDLIAELKPYYAIQLLDAVSIITDKAWIANNKEFQSRCRELLADRRDSVKVMWDMPNFPGLNGTERQRADQLKTALTLKADGSSNNSYEIAEAIFRACKGLPLQKPGDPRTEMIRMALNNECPSKAGNVDSGTNNLAEKIVNPGSDKASSNQKITHNGSEHVQLAAALVVLEKENSVFTHKDRTQAIEIIARILTQSSVYGYRRDAGQLLLAQLSIKDNLSLVVGLRNVIETNPELADKAVEIQGKRITLRQLLDESIGKLDCSELTNGTGRRSVKTAEGEIHLDFTSGTLQSILETNSAGPATRTRRIQGGFVVEHFAEGKLIKAQALNGQSYIDVLLADIEGRNRISIDEQLSSARRLLSGEPIGGVPTDKQRMVALKGLLSLTERHLPNRIRLAAAEYLFHTDRLGPAEQNFKRDGLKALARLAADGDDDALAVLRSLPVNEREQALREMIDDFERYIDDCREQDQAATRERKRLSALIDEDERKYGKEWADKCRDSLIHVCPPIYPDQGKLSIRLEQFAKLVSSTTPSRSTDALLFEFSLKSELKISAKNNRGRNELHALVAAAAHRLRTDSVRSDRDPRVGYVEYFYKEGVDRVKLERLRVKQSKLKSGSEYDKAALYIDVGHLIKSKDDSVSEDAAKLLESAPPEDHLLILALVMLLTEEMEKDPDSWKPEHRQRLLRVLRSTKSLETASTSR